MVAETYLGPGENGEVTLGFFYGLRVQNVSVLEGGMFWGGEQDGDVRGG